IRDRNVTGVQTCALPILLVDLIIPKDERSGSATEAGVPEFMDFMLGDDPELQTPVRGGLAWLDHECDDRYGKTFVACAAGERGEIGRASCRERGEGGGGG